MQDLPALAREAKPEATELVAQMRTFTEHAGALSLLGEIALLLTARLRTWAQRPPLSSAMLTVSPM